MQAAGPKRAVKQVLVAEDEPNIIVSLEFLLQAAGHAVSVARDGQQALDMIQASRPDLIVLDVMLPLVNGFEVCQRIRKDPGLRDVKILMLTAHGRKTEMMRGLEAGANAYMTKPFATHELLRAVTELLDTGGSRV